MYLCSSHIAFIAKTWSLWYVFLTSFLTNVRLWSFCQIPQRTASIATALNTNLTSGIRHPVRARYWQNGNADLIKYLFKTVKTTCSVWSCILNAPSWQQSRSQPQWSLGKRRQYEHHIQSAPDWLSRETSHPEWVSAFPLLFLPADYL